jgi:hypothetical protein
LGFDCQAESEFVLAKSLLSDFEIQGRFRAVGAGTLGIGAGSVATAVVIHANSILPIVQVSLPEIGRLSSCNTIDLFVDGSKVLGGTGSGITTPDYSVTETAEDIVIKYTAPGVVGVEVTLQKRLSVAFGCFFNTVILLPDDFNDGKNIIGLYGSPDGIKDNDWMNPAGIVLPAPTSETDLRFAAAHDYCTTNWCIANAGSSSLFTYETGESYATFDNSVAPFNAAVQNIIENGPLPAGLSPEICPLDDLVCLIDGIVGYSIVGNFDDAQRLVNDRRQLMALDSSCGGDPHFKTWLGDRYNFHGECDLVLLTNALFAVDKGLDIHIRTRIRERMSYITSVAIRIGNDVLEITGGVNGGHFINGMEGLAFPASLSNFPIKYNKFGSNQRTYNIDLGKGEQLSIKTFKYFMAVSIQSGTAASFGESSGLMGSYHTGKKLGRDGVTVYERDFKAFGQEWQVLATEPKLFHTTEGPQAPEICKLPTEADIKRRRLGSSLSDEAAEKACAHVTDKDDREWCVFDVLATGDTIMAGAY